MSYFSPLVAVLTTVLVIALILSSRLRNIIQDTPNERSLHSVPTPRIGGVGLIVGVLAGWAMMYTALTWWLLLPMIGLFIVSLLDDIYSLSVRQRFSAHLVAAAVLVGGSGLLEVQGITLALAIVLFVVWMTNLYNFMDGSDGLAGGMALLGFAAYGVAAWLAQDTVLAAASLTIAAAAFGFLLFNFHPARIFMGDVGSIPLGFLAAALGIGAGNAAIGRCGFRCWFFRRSSWMPRSRCANAPCAAQRSPRRTASIIISARFNWARVTARWRWQNMA